MSISVRKPAPLAIRDIPSERDLNVLIFIDAFTEHYMDNITMIGVQLRLHISVKDAEISLENLSRSGHLSASRYEVNGVNYPIYSVSQKGKELISSNPEHEDQKRIIRASFR